MEKKRRLKNLFVAATAIALLIGTITLSLPRAGKANASIDANVKVINTSTSPVPVLLQGQGGLTVQAQQSGSWNVGISGTPTVTVGNSTLFVANLDEPGRNRFQSSQNILFTTVSGNAVFVVPDGKVTVIEHVSMSGAVESGGTVQAFVTCFDGAQEVRHSLVLAPGGEVNGVTQYAASQPIKCYAVPRFTLVGGIEEPTGLVMHVQTSNINSAQHTWVMAASGYLVTP